MISTSSGESLDALIAQVFAQGRVCVKLLHSEVLPLYTPLRRTGAERVIRHILENRIFEQTAQHEMEVLIEELARHIEKGTSREPRLVRAICKRLARS